MKKITKLLMLLLFCSVATIYGGTVAKAATQIYPMEISRPNQIDEMIDADQGVVFENYNHNKDGDTTYEYYVVDITKRGYLRLEIFYDSLFYTFQYRCDLYSNESMTKEIKYDYNKSYREGARYDCRLYYYLNSGRYYIKSSTKNVAKTVYGYFLPSDSVLAANVTLSNDKSYATISCQSTIGDTAVYSWTDEPSQPSLIDNKKFFNNESITGNIKVTKNGTYSIRVKSFLQEWQNYPIDIQVNVEGIVPQTPVQTTQKPITQEPITKPQITTPEKVIVKKLTIKGKKKVKVGKKLLLKAIISPNNVTNKKVKWSVSNRKWASISKKGLLKAKKAGKGKKVTVICKALDGSQKVAKIKIKITK